MYRPSQTPHLNVSSVVRGRGKSARNAKSNSRTQRTPKCTRKTIVNSKRKRNTPISPDLVRVFVSLLTLTEWSTETKGIVVSHVSTCVSHLYCTSNVSVQIQTRVKLNRVFFPRCVHASPFPCLLVHMSVDRDSRNLVNPFMRVTNYMTRHLATCRDFSQKSPIGGGFPELYCVSSFTRGCQKACSRLRLVQSPTSCTRQRAGSQVQAPGSITSAPERIAPLPVLLHQLNILYVQLVALRLGTSKWRCDSSRRKTSRADSLCHIPRQFSVTEPTWLTVRPALQNGLLRYPFSSSSQVALRQPETPNVSSRLAVPHTTPVQRVFLSRHG